MLFWLTKAIASTTAAMVFFSIFLLGAVFSSLSVIFGGHGGNDHDVGGVDHDIGGVDHDVGGVDHETDIAGHDTDHGEVSADSHDGGTGVFHGLSVGMLSVRGIALLSTGFGGVGFLVQIYTGKVLFSATAGTLVGCSFAFAILYILKVFKAQQANSLIDTSAAIGGSGVVLISIPSDGIGEVRFTVSGVEMVRPAVSKDGERIQSGTPIRIEEISGGIFIVAPKR